MNIYKIIANNQDHQLSYRALGNNKNEAIENFKKCLICDKIISIKYRGVYKANNKNRKVKTS